MALLHVQIISNIHLLYTQPSQMTTYSNPLQCLFVKQKKAVGEGKNFVNTTRLAAWFEMCWGGDKRKQAMTYD